MPKTKHTTSLSPNLTSESLYNEEIRMIRANLDQVLMDGPVLIMMTSTDDVSQKSVISAQLAAAFAEQGKKVLLIDANIRKPSIHNFFHISNTTGLVNSIVNQEDLKMSIKETYFPGLSILPAGSLLIHTSEIWITSKLKRLEASCRAEFEVIIFEAPPFMAYSDAHILANHCDGIVLVVEGNKTKKETIFKTRESLLRSNKRILGVIYLDG